MEEIFKQISDFPDYEISNYGRIKSKSRLIRYVHAVTGNEHFRKTTEIFLKIYEDKNGYQYVQLLKSKKSNPKKIHRLVLMAFDPIDNPENYEGNHIYGNKRDNFIDHLEWATPQYNHEHAITNGLSPKGERIGVSKLNDRSVYAIKWFLQKGISHTELARAFQVSRATISFIHENKIWKHIILTIN